MSALPVSFISTWRLVRGRGRGQARIIVEVEAGPARFGSYRKPMGVWGRASKVGGISRPRAFAVVAGVEDYQVALATYGAACERWPGPLPRFPGRGKSRPVVVRPVGRGA